MTSVDGFKDHFSAQAAGYRHYRPRYPAALFAWLATVVPRRGLAWDCATGNGQAASGLAAHFERVIATDASARQLAAASPIPGVTFRIGRAEASDLAAGTMDLVTVAQAAHWFDHAAFHAEARRVLRPAGVLAVWAYGLLQVAPTVDPVIQHFYTATLDGYWPAERGYIDRAYRDLPFPFPELAAPAFAMRATWSFEQLLGYVGSWSAVQAYRRATGTDPVAELREELLAGWGEHRVRGIHWPLYLRVGRPPA